MTTGQKVLAGVVVLVVALFALTIGTQGNADAGSDGTAPRSGFVDLLTERFASSATVPATELTGSCRLTGDSIVVQGSCVVDVAASGSGVRKLTMRNAGAPARITARVPLRSDTATTDVDPHAAVSVAVDGEGTSIRIACVGLSVCVLEVTGGG